MVSPCLQRVLLSVLLFIRGFSGETLGSSTTRQSHQEPPAASLGAVTQTLNSEPGTPEACRDGASLAVDSVPISFYQAAKR